MICMLQQFRHLLNDHENEINRECDVSQFEFLCPFFDNIKEIEIIKLREIMKLHNAIDDHFGSNVLRNFHRNAESRWMIAVMNTTGTLISNSSIMLNNANKNIREICIEIILKKKLSMFRYKSREYFVIERGSKVEKLGDMFDRHSEICIGEEKCIKIDVREDFADICVSVSEVNIRYTFVINTLGSISVK